MTRLLHQVFHKNPGIKFQKYSRSILAFLGVIPDAFSTEPRDKICQIDLFLHFLMLDLTPYPQNPGIKFINKSILAFLDVRSDAFDTKTLGSNLL
jgi:hypothetical protein